MAKDQTPPSGKRMPDGPAPQGYGKTLPDKESPNVGETFDSTEAIFPLKEVDYLPNADGIG